MFRKLLAVIGIAAIAATACGSSSHPAATTTSAPHRIVSLSPTATEMVYAVGAGSQVVAVDIYSTYPPEAPKSKLNGFDAGAESVAAEHPDLVLVAEDNTTKLIDGLKALNIKVLVLPTAKSLDDTYAQLRQIGDATGHANEADAAVTKVKDGIAAVLKSVGDKANGLTYYHELDNMLFSATSHTFIGQLYGMLGMVNIADAAPSQTAGEYPQLSAEYIVKKNPDFVFLADTICCQQNATTFAARNAFGQLKAVKDGHVVALSDDVASHWGPRVVDFLQAVAGAVTKR